MALNHRPTTIIAAIMVCIFLFPFSAGASGFDTERDIQKKLEHSREIAGKAKGKQKKGEEAQEEIKALTERAKEINELHLALQEDFKAREQEVSVLGAKAIGRHKEMVEFVNKALDDYLNLIENLQTEIYKQGDRKAQQFMIEEIEKHLESILHKKKLPILGALPYRQLNYPATEPDQASAITPAYKGGNKTVSPADLEGTEEAPVSSEIAAFAQSLNWNPVLLYEYVKNNVETEWYRGCMKGAEETLRQKSGNDCDQAALLISLLRASGFPSRYVRGTMEFFAGGVNGIPMEKVKNLTGIEDPWKIAEFFQKAGIPYTPIIAGGKITNFQIEHLWVESQIPYANYRGTVIDEHGKTWLGLDTSIKPKGYTYNTATDIFQQPAVSAQLSAMRDEYLALTQTQTLLEYLRAYMNAELGTLNPGVTYNDLLRTKTLNPEILNLLPASMQFVEQKITHEYTAIPDELKHKVRFVATDSNNSVLMNLELSALKLSNRQITLTYEPETVEDQEIINHYGGLDNTPAYLVRLRPTLKVDGERMVIAQDGLPMGADYDFAIELISPNGTEKTINTHIVGNLSSVGIVAEKANSSQHTAISEEDDAETILHKEAVSYIDRWNKSEEELASLLHLTWTRPIPTVTTVGGVLDVTYFLNVPVGVEWKGVYLDACARSIEATPSHSPLTQEGESERQKTFMQLSALEGSALEHKVFEDDFQVESISTAKLFSIAGSTQNAADRGEILTIDKTNINSVLPTLPFDDNIKEDITNAVNQNLIVKIPLPISNQPSAISYLDWTGIGYIKENPDTGEAGYMLSGMIAGGMTAVSPYKWSNRYLAEKLGKPYGNTLNTIVITDPKNGTTASAPFITVSGIVIDSNAIVSVNGVEAIVDGNTFTATGIALNEGINIIKAIALNQAGKQTSDTITVKYETPVSVYISFPYDGAELSVSPIDVEGIVSDAAATVIVNGINATVLDDGRFVATGILLSEGVNQIKAQASLSGKTGTHTINVKYTAREVAPISITITYPEDNAVIDRPTITVRGTVTTEANEVSIKVNGIIAEKYGNQFVANGMPLVEGMNKIIVNALGSNGAVGRAEITVNAITSGPYITLRSNITSGIPPLTAYFSVSTEIPNPAASYQIDFKGDGIIDYTGSSFEDISHTYTTEGIFYPTITVTDDQGNTYSDTIAITVLNKAEIDALLKSKWEGMKSAMIIGDISGALRYISSNTQEMYSYNFELMNDLLPAIVQSMSNISLDELANGIAKYHMNAIQDGIDYSFYIEFIKDINGLWKIRFF